MAIDATAESVVLRADEVCRMLRIGRNTLYSLCQQDKIPHMHIGDRIIRFSKRSIENWMDKQNSGGGL
jgi:excisionase family DNA binding protein